MPTAISWDEFRLVKAIADARSLVGAAEKLAINHSTVFRRLGALEEVMGARLFERSRNGYTPTATGEEMIALATRMEQEIVDFERAVAGRSAKPAGELRLTTNDAFLNWLLGPMLASFRVKFPQIRLDVVVGHEHLNLSRRDADVALRATLEPPETLVGRKIAHIAWAAYGPKAWKGPDNERQWVGFGEGPGVAGARRWFEDNVAPDAIVCRVDSVAGVARAVEAGIGSGLLPCFIGDRLAGVARLGDKLPFGDDMWLLTHPDLRHSARVRAFMEHAGAELARMRHMIEGET
jgi:DNA-binding transcriptional LysR family regulator